MLSPFSMQRSATRRMSNTELAASTPLPCMNDRAAPCFRTTFLTCVAFSTLTAFAKAPDKRPVPLVFLSPGTTHALVVGASNGSKWLDWEKAQLHIRAGEKYRFFTLT